MHRHRKKTIFHVHARLQNINSSFCNFGNMMKTKLTSCCLKMSYFKSQYLSNVIVVYHGEKRCYLQSVLVMCSFWYTKIQKASCNKTQGKNWFSLADNVVVEGLLWWPYLFPSSYLLPTLRLVIVYRNEDITLTHSRERIPFLCW